MITGGDELVIAPQVSELRRASEWLNHQCTLRGLSEDASGRLELCLNEAVANVLEHGGPQALSAPIQLRLQDSSIDGAAMVTLRLCYAGPAFDAVTAVMPARPETLQEAQPGGLGLRMLRQFSDALQYQREGEHNHLVLSVLNRQAEPPTHFLG